MRSESQIAASRANGAKSRGPKTPEGKARSARNALRHGLLADTILFEDESESQFQQLVEGYTDTLDPANEVERTIVDELCAATWRLRRAWVMENRFFHEALATQPDPTPIPADRVTQAFATLADTPKLNLLHRYETRLHMMYQRAFRNLLQLRKLNPPAGPNNSPVPNEPKKPPVINTPPTPEPTETQAPAPKPCPRLHVSPAKRPPLPHNPSRLRLSASDFHT